MTGDEWRRLEALFDDARVLPAEARPSWLTAACDDPAMRALVAEMLTAYDADPGFLESPAEIVDAVADVVADGLVGHRLGPYRLTGQIGQGGMGVVYDAVRDDEAFERRVAVKVLPPWGGSTAAERFRLERRVLASLDHTGIARLLDSGTTPNGAPYFVMEFVDGQSIHDWCDSRGYDVRQRVALLERVCDAVAYAHQHLVVHRDLKPGNILVTADGQPKLLDFGIATLVSERDGVAAGVTRTGHQSYTLDFASPEQIRGGAVTTATDVYSLGVLAYLLLSGQRPHALTGLPPMEAMRVVCDVDPPLPSAVATAHRAQLRGALDAVVAKALRKAPEDRYATVAALGADFRAWREGQPVSAAPEPWWPRAYRVLRRNKAAVAVLCALLAGGAVAAWQARVAAGERDRAQNRFRQVREFSRSLIFDVNAALAAVPGNTEPRRLVLDRAMQFLDGLAADAAEDDELAEELVEGYRRLGRVQGDARARNVGDAAGAAASLEKAVTIAERLLRDRPADLGRLEVLLGTVEELSRAYSRLGDASRAIRGRARHLELVGVLERDHPGNARAIARAADGYSDAGLFLANDRDIAGARPLYERAAVLYELLPADERLVGSPAQSYAFLLKRLGAVLLVSGDLGESERRYRAALAIEERGLQSTPNDAEKEWALTFTLSDLGAVVSRQGRREEAAALWERALAIRRRAANADAKDLRAAGGVAVLLWRTAIVAAERRQHAAAVAGLREMAAIQERLLAAQGQLPRPVTERAWAIASLADALLQRVTAEPRHRARDAWRAEARRLLSGLRADDAKVPVVFGSPADFASRLADLRRRVALDVAAAPRPGR